MKTKTLFSKSIFSLLVIVTLFSCSKENTKPTTGSLATLSGSWTTTAWGGINGNQLTFNIDGTAATGTITQVGSQPYGFLVGDQLFTGITFVSTGTYSATGKYTFGTNNANSATRAATITLQNNNTQITVDYPAINGNFPEITYVYQKGSGTIVLN